jgi:lactoylglutathione lyase
MAHMGYYVTDLGKARAYYEGLLGFQEAFALKNADGSDHAVFIKINDHQYIELVAETPKNHGFLYDVAFETNDAKGMRDHLASLGISVPGKVVKDATGNLSFDITDPSGFTIQIVQYMPDSLTSRSKGKFMPSSRISTHIDHLGLLVNDRESSWKFYGDTFGFVKEGDGSKMAVPGSEDRFELGVERKPPTIDRYHVKDHICLSAPDVPKVTAELQAKPAMSEFPKAIADIHQLGSGKHVIEIYDADGNRVELMEPPADKATSGTTGN